MHLSRILRAVAQGNDLVFSMEGGISIAEDPNFRFTFKPNGAATFRAAIRQARRWLDNLISNPNETVEAIASREGKTERSWTFHSRTRDPVEPDLPWEADPQRSGSRRPS
jgi:Sulphur oxidation protein SoxZ